MNRSIPMRVAGGLFCAAFAQVSASAVGCAASTDAAVLQALRGGNQEHGLRNEGYRVRDVVVDPLLHRAFVHVEQCGHPERPLVLLPFATAQLSMPAGLPVGTLGNASLSQSVGGTVRSGSVVSVAMGDAHMRLAVQGKLLQNAAVGSDVDVQLVSLNADSAQPGEEAKRVHGRLTAVDRVEVQP